MSELSQREQSDLAKIELLLAADQIYMPKALMLMRLHDRTTLLVSEIITDNRFKAVDEVKYIVADNIDDDELLLLYAFNDPKIAKRMKRELQRVVDEWYKIFPNKECEVSGQ